MSNEPKWTPGPWVKGFNGHYWDIGLKRNESSGLICPTVCIGVPSDQEANASLIAAAPELYGALDRLLEQLESTAEINLSSWGISIAQARYALAKARGERA